MLNRTIIRSCLVAGAAVVAGVLPTAAPADASSSRVLVPLDRARPDGPKLALHVERLRATRRTRGTVLFLSGGPGESATPALGQIADLLGSRVRRTRDVVAFDARGTGRSGLLRCPELQRDPGLRSSRAAAGCARTLGPRVHYTTVADQVADVEDVRRRLRIRRLDLYGVSYGTEVAQRYAQAHPSRVGRVVLDSVLPAEGPSALGLEIFAGMPRVLGELCLRARCANGVPDPPGQVAALVARLARAPMEAQVFDADGRLRPGRLDRVALLDVLLAGDFSPALRAALPAALAAAARGDAAMLLHLAALDRAAAPPLRASDLSAGAYAATSCSSLGDLPWDPAADATTRREQAAQRLRELGDAPFRPFDAATILDADFLPLCLPWPAPRQAPAPVAPALPDVPMLLLAGSEDLRTPVESARLVAERAPRAKLLVIPGVGHSVVVSDERGCARRALQRFVARQATPGACPRPRRRLPPVPIPPSSTDDLGPARTPSEARRRTLRALDLTLDDVTLGLAIGTAYGGGLRGGRYAVGRFGVALRGFSYVPGIVFDGRPRRGGRLDVRVSGPATPAGRLAIGRTGAVTGHLGGVRVRARLRGGPPTT